MPAQRPDGAGGRMTCAAGVTKATLAAGPVFTWSLAAMWTVGGSRPVEWPDAAWLLAALFPPVMVVGGLLAVVPNLIGAALLGRLGSDNAGGRLPVIWALVGGLAAGGGAAACGAEAALVAAFAATGAICALLCRAGIRWRD